MCCIERPAVALAGDGLGLERLIDVLIEQWYLDESGTAHNVGPFLTAVPMARGADGRWVQYADRQDVVADTSPPAMDSEQAAAPGDVMAETVAGPDGAVPVGEMSTAQLIIAGTKAHTCVACESAIPKGDPSMLAHGGGHRWRLCRRCAPPVLGGYPIAWGRSCIWRITNVRTVERQERRVGPYHEYRGCGPCVGP